MIDDPKKVRCAAFQAQMPDLIGSGDIRTHPHLQGCKDCSDFLADLEAIAEAARQLFPGVEPPDEVWEHIESAIKRQDEGNGIEPGVAPRTC